MSSLAICRQSEERREHDIYTILKRRLLTGIQLQLLAKTVLEHLAAKLDETIYLAVPNGDQMLIVDSAQCARQDEFCLVVGRRYPLMRSEADKDFPAYVSLELRHARKDSSGEESLSGRLLTAPVWNGQQSVCGWLCIFGSTDHFTPKRIRELLPDLRNRAERLTASLKGENIG